MKKIDFAAIFSVRSSYEKDDLDLEPSAENSWGEFGDYQLVGNGEITNDYCGKFRTFYGCPRVELHDRRTLDGKNFKGKIFYKPVFTSCDKPSCPACYIGGWAVREAREITARLREASKRFGLVEHIVVSVPAKDYGLSLEVLRKKVDKVLKRRGVVGGVKIFHGFRYNVRKHWYFSPHFHVLGFILGGYRRCRRCKRKWNCLKGCGGFDDRAYQLFLKDGYYVKVKGKRVSVYHTAWYQLNHASVKKNVKRFHVATWFGCCSYRKLKVTVEFKKSVCPICRHDLVELRYFGDNSEIFGIIRSNRRSCEKRWGYADLMEDGRVVWFEKVKRGEG